jgi:AcrR family transcriptional regulator
MAAANVGMRERLLCAAQEELTQGQGHLEMQAVARRARVSVGLAHHHFGSKAGLIAAVVEEFYSRLDTAAFQRRQVAVKRRGKPRKGS